MIRKLIGLTYMFLLLGNTYAQTSSFLSRKQLLVVSSSSIKIDTLSIVPNSVRLFTISGNVLDSLLYSIDYANASIDFTDRSLFFDSLHVSYAVFPYLFSKSAQHKELKLVNSVDNQGVLPFYYSPLSNKSSIFSMGNLDKSGSISRGISFGNSQDLSVNSSLNLQLSGKLDNGVHVLLAATDNNIPIQPDGNTQQLQDFDQVFVQLSKDSSVLIAGDYRLGKPNGYFMQFNKKAQGVKLSTVQAVSLKNKRSGNYAVTASGALSRGKFSRNVIQGVEGNQGPYRLVGAENEPFIIVLSGTEKVYIDGQLQKRGQENDYVIDYNTSEIIFTANQLITKDKRIVVQFQYSDRNYARSLFYLGNSYAQGRLKLYLDMYSEQDSKNQPLQQDLSDAQKVLLSEIGDSLSLAVSSGVDSVGYSANEVLYKKEDSVVAGVTYSILKYSTNSDSAVFRATFRDLGFGNGNYVQLLSNANGRVFGWVAPDSISGELQGRYEPVVTLVTPKQKQLLTAGLNYDFGDNAKLFIEGGFSRYDKNTFSSKNGNDDRGYGLKLKFDDKRVLSRDSTKENVFVLSSVNYEYISANLSPIERYRSVEFERDWNRNIVPTTLAAQHLFGANLGLNKVGLGAVSYHFRSFLEGEEYAGVSHGLRSEIIRKGLAINYDGSVLTSSGSQDESLFYRHFAKVSQRLKGLRFGLQDQLEYNRKGSVDSILSTSYRFWEWKAFVENVDSTNIKYGLEYFRRVDYGVNSTISASSFSRATLAESYSSYFGLLKNPSRRLTLRATYRSLKVLDSLISSNVREDNLLSRIEYNAKFWKGFVASSSFYEVGSGLELKKEFEYVEVAAGQGVYAWVDYNQNEIKELNEFEVAAFSSDASFIRVFTPTQEYLKVYRNQFSQQLSIKPQVRWNGKKGVKGFFARMTNLTVYKIDRKSSDLSYQKVLNPFRVRDTANLGLTSIFRNTLFFNQRSPVWGVNLTYQNNNNATLLINGVDSRSQEYWEMKGRWNLSSKYSSGVVFKGGGKVFDSPFFSERSYQIDYQEISPNIAFQPSTVFRLNAIYKYATKSNQSSLEASELNNYGVEIKYNVLQKGSLNASLNYIRVQYNGEVSTSLAYEMLEGLQVGENYTWTARYQRNFANNMQVSLNYEGRKSVDTKIIHTGGAQVRAYF